MKTTPRLLLLAAALLAPILARAAAPVAVPGVNLIPNPGFELGDSSWTSFIPGESKEKSCTFSVSTVNPHSGKACGELRSSDYARFSVGPRAVESGPIMAGERCRLTFWVRADPATQTRSVPGFIVRMILWSEDGKQLPDDEALYVGLNGVATLQSMSRRMDLSGYTEPLPVKWTKVEVVFDVPEMVNLGSCKLGRPEFFAHYTLGSIFIDDISLERVGKAVPLTTKQP